MRYSLSHVANQVLVQNLFNLVARDRVTTAELLAHLAEVEVRRLYLPAAYPSMYEYCVRELKLSEHSALKRLRAARAARKYPVIFDAVADGRLHLSAVVMLAPHLTRANAGELVAVAEHRSKLELESLLAQRYPRPDLQTLVQAVAVAAPPLEVAPGPVAGNGATDPGGNRVAFDSQQVVAPTCKRDAQVAPGPPVSPTSRARIEPLSARRFGLQVTIDQEAHELMVKAQALLGHAVPSGDVAEVLKRALRALVNELERRKFARTRHPLPSRGAPKGRHIPAEVRRAVTARDGARCTFLSVNGQRCPAISRLEFDHVQMVAHGGRATVENLRLRCQKHNLYEAERRLGARFMQGKSNKAQHPTAVAGRTG